MPFTTGTARTPSELLNAINTHLVANGWTRIRGETDMNCAAPKAARYWRLLAYEIVTTTNDFPGVQRFDLRTTIGGASAVVSGAGYSVSSLGTGNPANLATGGVVRAADIDDAAWWVRHDFGSPVTIREVVIQADSTVGNTPRDFLIQWSNDGETWTTMFERTGETWTASQTRTYSWADGTRYSGHVADNAPRRSGNAEDILQNLQFGTTSPGRELGEDYWIWQGPGYDASRRVYIHARGFCRATSSTHAISWDFSIGYDAAIRLWNSQVGNTSLSRTHLMDSGTVTYWLYSNSKRIVLVTRSGTQDYTSSYVGFMSAFGTPDQYPFPLMISTTSVDQTTYVSGSSNSRLSSCADPGRNGTVVRLWDGTLIYPDNRPDNSATSNLYLQTPSSGWVWPYHTGSAARGDWPLSQIGDYVDYAGHFLDRMIPTAQGTLPLFPCVVQSADYGNIGVLDGVFAVPGGGVLTPLQVLTIGGVNYRVFPNRTRRDGVNWMAIRED
ncbi:distal tail protein [Pseudanabaena phage Pan1]|nr:distal tail protein [Pseudanabaena phage Pan1]